MLKVCIGEARSMIYRMVNKVWEEEKILTKWRITLHKKEDTTNCKTIGIQIDI